MKNNRWDRLAESLAPILRVPARQNVSLAELSNWKIGGRARLVVEPETPEQVAAVLRLLAASEVPHCVVGGTSNILFDSAGLEGVLVRLGSRLGEISIDGNLVRAGAGADVTCLVLKAAKRGLVGAEHAAGIPGTIGGLVVMNGGTQRRGIGSHVDAVTVADSDGNLKRLSGAECNFAYRTSRLQRGDLTVVGVDLKLESGGDPDRLLAAIEKQLESRRERFPADEPSGGSTFLSGPEAYAAMGPPGAAIEAAGLKGAVRGGAQISPRHANFFVNAGGATSSDILHLVALARDKVFAKYGYLMDTEVLYVSPSGETVPAHVAADRLRFEAKG